MTPKAPDESVKSGFREQLEAQGVPFLKRAALGVLSLLVAAAIWLPAMHWVFKPRLSQCLSVNTVSPRARALAAQHFALWNDPRLRAVEIGKMRASNAEWDFMGRTFFVMALGNMALRDPARASAYLDVMDAVIDETIRLDRTEGPYFFLMSYAHSRPFVQQPPRSLFVDGEIALMLGMRRLVEEKESYKALLAERVQAIVERMNAGPILCAESYPDECWTFCNTAALASLRIADALDGTNHREFFKRWIRSARENLIDRKTGLLVSSFALDASPSSGPKGSTIWMAAHCLQLIDEEFAADQYRRARRELGRELIGFGYSRECPVSKVELSDVDSGPVIPYLNASTSASGLAIMGAAAFGDRDYFSALCTSLDFAGFPIEREGRLKYCASNQVGDAVLLYAMVLGPAWEKVKASKYAAPASEVKAP